MKEVWNKSNMPEWAPNGDYSPPMTEEMAERLFSKEFLEKLKEDKDRWDKFFK